MRAQDALMMLVFLFLPVFAHAQFVENKGQVLDHAQNFHPEVLYLYSTGESSVFFEKDKIVYVFSKKDAFDFKPYEGKQTQIDSIKNTLGRTIQRIDMEFKGANPSVTLEPGEKAPGRINYFLNKREHITDVPVYRSVTYHNVYDNIDFVFYQHEKGLKYDIILHSGADINDIKLYYNGASSIREEGGRVLIKTLFHDLYEEIPLAYIDDDKENKTEVRYRVKDGLISFETGAEEYGKLTIDPTLTWATYFETISGGGGLDYDNNIADDAGNLFISAAAFNSSNDFPTVNPGGSAYIDSYNSAIDMYIAKFNPSRALVWATYFGGSSTDWSLGTEPLAIHGNILHIVGDQGSADMPYVNGGGYFANTPTGRPFYLRFDKNSGQLLHSTVIGGHSSAHPSIAVSSSGQVAIMMSTYDFGNPSVMARAGAYNQSTNGGYTDLFLMLLNSSYNQIWGTWLGGPGSQEDPHVAFDSNGNIFFVGEVSWLSGSNAGTEHLVNLAGSYYQSTSVSEDIMIGKFNSNGALVWNTLYGGNAYDGIASRMGNGSRVVINPANNELIVMGGTNSSNLPLYTLAGAYNKTAPANVNPSGGSFGDFDSFILKFSNNGVWQWGTYWGDDTDGDLLYDGQFTSCNKFILAARAYSAAIALPGHYNQATGGQSYLMQMNSNYAAEWASYVGTSTSVPAIAFTPYQNRLYLSTATYSTTLPTVDPGGGAYYDNVNTGSTVSYSIWEFNIIPMPVISGTISLCSGNSTTLTASGGIGSTYAWYTAASGGTPFFTGSSYTTPVLNSSVTYYVSASNGTCTSERTPVTVTVTPTPSTPNFTSNSPICAGSALNLNGPTVSGATYVWSGPNSFSSSVENPSISNATTAASGTYNLYVIVSGCTSATATQTVTVNPIPATPNFTTNSPVCAGSTLNLNGPTVSGATYVWSGPNSFTSSVENPSISNVSAAAAGTYNLRVVVSGCSSAVATQTVTVNPAPATPNFTTNSPLCSGSTLNLNGPTVSGATYVWSGPNSFSSSVEDPSISNATTAASGTYSLRVVVSGCSSAVATQTVTVNPIPATPNFSTNSPLCAGSTLNLNGPTVPGATYVWSGPNSFGSSVEDPSISNATAAASGTYSLYIVQNGCTSATATQSVSVSAIAAAPAFTTNSPICSGGNVSLDGPTIPGATYVWSGPNSFSATTEDAAVNNATTAASGTYSLYVVTGGCTSATATQTVTVNATPATPNFSTNSPLCAGSSLNLNGPTVSGATYVWSGPNSFSSSSEDPSISNATTAASGTYSLYVIVNGCNSVAATQTVTVNPIPATPNFTTNSPICAGSALNLNGPTVSGATYVWSGPNSFSSSVEDPGISNATTAASGTYNLTIVVSGCSSAVATQAVTVNPIPATPNFSTNSPLCAGSTLNLNGPTVPGATYVWSGPNSFSSSAEDPGISNVTTAASGTYNLTVVVSGCTSATATQTVTVNATPATPAFTSNTPVCSGSTLNLNGPTVSGATYVWSGPNSFGSSVEDPSIAGVSAAAAGTYSLVVVVNGCSSATATQNVVVNTTPATPSFSSNSPICSGSALNLTTAAVSGASYVWSGPNGFSSGIQSPSIPSAGMAAAGAYSLVVVVSGCSSGVSTQNIVVNSSPVISMGTFTNPNACGASTGSFTVNGSGTGNITWTGASSGAAVSVALPYSINNIPAGSYSVTFVSAAGCSSNVLSASLSDPNPPSTPLFSVNTSVCTGATLNFDGPTVSGATYVWSGPNSFGSSAEDPVLSAVTPAASGTYSLFIVVGGCTSATATQTVTVNPIPAAPVFTIGSPVCAGGSVTLDGPTVSGATYTWSGPAGFSSTLEDPILTSLTGGNSGTYSLSVTVNGCTSPASTQTLTVNPLPNIGANASAQVVCTGSQVVLTGSGGLTYSWSNGVSDGIPFIPASTALYTVTGTDANGCTATDTITVVVSANGGINLAINSSDADTTVCAGSEITLTASGASSYLWTNNGATTAAITVNPTSATTYTVIGLAGVCSDTLQISVNVLPVPAYDITASDNSICEGDSAMLTAVNGTGAALLWSTGANTVSVWVKPSATSTYTLTATDNVNGCIDITTVTIIVNPEPVVGLSDSVLVCGNTQAILDAGAGFSTYQWSTGAATATLVVTQNGLYQVVVTDANGCSGTGASYVTISPFDPTAGITGDTQGAVCEQETFTFAAQGGVAYSWTGPNNFSSTSASNEINNVGSNNVGDYIVTIYNKDNCSLQDTVTLSLLSDGECETITELVTPNNDGKNDALIIGFLDKYPNHKLTIYNRWGSAVYKAQPYANDWDGKANTGAVVGKDGYLPVGTYFYILETGTNDKPIKGFIELQY